MKRSLALVSFALFLVGNILSAAEVVYAGGDGSSFEKAVLIKNATEETGVRSEYAYLAKYYPDSKVVRQSLRENKGRMYDVLEIEAKGGAKSVYFDITEFFGKFD